MIRYHELKIGSQIRETGTPFRAVVKEVHKNGRKTGVWATCDIIQYSDGPLAVDDPEGYSRWNLTGQAAQTNMYLLPIEGAEPVKATSMIPASVYMEKFGTVMS